MIEPKRIFNKLTWQEPSYVKDPNRKALFSLMYYEDDNLIDNSSGVPSKSNLYFVNESDEILKKVSTSSGGFFTIDDEHPVSVGGKDLTYENVLPNEAVFIESYDNFYDLDYLLGLTLYIQSDKLEKLRIRAIPDKGGVKPQALIFEDGTVRKYVVVQKIDESDDDIEKQNNETKGRKAYLKLYKKHKKIFDKLADK